MGLNRLLCKAGAASVSIALSIYLWNQPLPEQQFWTLNIVDLAFAATALAIRMRAKEDLHAVSSQHGRQRHPSVS
jgi:hypothetical protein